MIRSIISLVKVASYKPHRVRSSHIARFSSGVCSTVVEGAIPADNAGGTVGSDCGGSMGKGGAGWPVRSEGGRGGELRRVALGCQEKFIGRRLDEERGTSPGLSALKAVAGRVGREGGGLIKDEEVEACALGDIGLGILGDDVDDCGSCRPLFEIIGLTSFKLDVRGSRLVLEFRGDPACSCAEEAILSCLAERNGDLERERLRLCPPLGYPESRRNPGP